MGASPVKSGILNKGEVVYDSEYPVGGSIEEKYSVEFFVNIHFQSPFPYTTGSIYLLEMDVKSVKERCDGFMVI